MNLIPFDYQGLQVTFTPEGWFDATAAAARWGRNPHEWLRLPATVEYVAALERKYGKFPHSKTKRGAGGGTWLHPRLAVYFARWLGTHRPKVQAAPTRPAIAA